MSPSNLLETLIQESQKLIDAGKFDNKIMKDETVPLGHVMLKITPPCYMTEDIHFDVRFTYCREDERYGSQQVERTPYRIEESHDKQGRLKGLTYYYCHIPSFYQAPLARHKLETVSADTPYSYERNLAIKDMARKNRDKKGDFGVSYRAKVRMYFSDGTSLPYPQDGNPDAIAKQLASDDSTVDINDKTWYIAETCYVDSESDLVQPTHERRGKKPW